MAMRKLFYAILNIPPDERLDVNQTAQNNTERIVIDQRGGLGSAYDAYTDNITGKLTIKIKSQCHKLTSETKCILIQNCKLDAPNRLKFVDIDHQLRLSILLKMTSATGIASLIDYPQLIDEHTRFLYIYHESYIDSYDNHLHELRKLVTTSACETYGTHIITGIVYGVHLLVILQLPLEKKKDIDILLLNMYPSLSNNEHARELNSNGRALLNQIVSTTVYSNINDLTKTRKFEDVYDKIIELQKNKNNHRPVKYILTPIRWFYGSHAAPNFPKFVSCKPDEMKILEYYLVQQSAEFKRLIFRINHELSESLQEKFNNRLRDIQDALSRLRILQEKDITRIRDRLWMIRKGEENYSTLNNEKWLDPPDDIQRLISTINTQTEELEAKIKLIKRLQQDGFEYCNVAELGIREGLTEQKVNEIMLGNDSNTVIFFSNDTFRKQNPEDWVIIYSGMIEERKNNPRLQFVYADFTYSEYKLPAMKIARLIKPITNNNLSSFRSLRHSTKRKAPLPPSSTNEYINILLLGESGVGKSTFINAFANYLRFQNLEEAQQGEPIVIIPVSYVMTINDDFEERIIKFGDVDPNENHNDFGQSVTQQCKSYVFNISKEKKLRIIDTPGFGDTRGDQQDDLNMEEIFSFLNHFTYLNGICLLFKPEISQLNPYFRSCCTKLFDYFGENIRDHFIFCFTNARSTFFAPGNARPLLNAFFDTLPVKNIPFGKANTFSFDSESFRYLVAIRNSIEFDPSQRGEFKQSWEKSVVESQRFRDFLCRQDAYRKNDKWQSIKDAQFQINYTIRPILEATRNLLRNTILSKSNSSIQLYATPTEPSVTICYSCSRKTPEKFGQFWILPDHLHHSPNTCLSNEQKPTEYRLNYESFNDQEMESVDQRNTQLKCLYETCGKFTYFLMNISQTLPDDPFLTGIDRMIEEEQFICHTQTSNDANGLLIDGLKQFKTKYQDHLNTIKLDKNNPILSNIYDFIESMNRIHMVKIQLNAIREYQQHLVDNNQRAVRVNETDKK